MIAPHSEPRPSASLNAARRSLEIEQLADGESVDLLVAGGGVTGVGVALDAASRGLSVALVERADLANGTSRWSSKLIHGGLRYLRQFELGLAWESARERHIMLRWTAPHLVRALPFLVPLNHAVPASLGALSELGIRVGDGLRLVSGSRAGELPGPRRINAHEALRLAPRLSREGLRGAILFWDGQAEDDARIVIAIARTAARHGARILTRCSLDRVDGELASVTDRLSGRRFEIRARHVINATGVWAGELDPAVSLAPSKGAHLIVDAQVMGSPRAAVITPVPGESARWVGATPTGDGRVIVGVTDDPHLGPVDDVPSVLPEEETFLLGVLARALDRPVRPDQVIGRFAGFRPLLRSEGEASADLSRRHALVDSADHPMTTIVGGKFTTYRLMAEQAVDHVLRLRAIGAGPCRTARLPLMGAGRPDDLARIDAPERLVRRYGAEAPRLLALAAGREDLLAPLAPGLDALGVELLFGLRHEGAIDLSDLLDRRLRIGLVPSERERAVGAAEALLAGEVAAA